MPDYIDSVERALEAAPGCMAAMDSHGIGRVHPPDWKTKITLPPLRTELLIIVKTLATGENKVR